MSDNIFWVLEFSIKSGEFDNFNTLMNDMVESTQNEPGTMNYEWFLSEDNTSCHVYERYVDSAALLAHLGVFGEKFAERFLGIVEPTGLKVYGNANDEVKEALSGFGAVHLTPAAGFAR